MDETTWVRSVYLYVMCAVSVALVGFGVVGFAVGVVHAVAPDLGHRDAIDRVGIGLSNIGSDVVDLFDEGQLDSIRDYCEDVTDDEDELEDCIEEEQSFESGGDELESIQQGIGSVESELRSQIRNSSVDRMIKGALMIVAGLVLFRIHGKRTELFADGVGLQLRRRKTVVSAGTTLPEPPPPPDAP
jgi:hypothetical protein